MTPPIRVEHQSKGKQTDTCQTLLRMLITSPCLFQEDLRKKIYSDISIAKSRQTFPPKELVCFHLVDIMKRLNPFFDCSYTARRQMCGPAVTNVRTNVVCVFKTNSSRNFMFPPCFPFSLLTLFFALKKKNPLK